MTCVVRQKIMDIFLLEQSFILQVLFMMKKLTILFIDEAGQLSVADLISIGNVAKNIILIGDQNQLGQPIKGTHPNESGQSILRLFVRR